MPPPSTAGEVVLHASAVALGRRGMLITGASGSGKSTLALQLIARGASLVADDRVIVRPLPEGGLHMSAPTAIRGMIEARGVGLIRSEAADALAVAVVDMDRTETARLPEAREVVIAGEAVRLIRRVEGPAFPDIVFLYLRGGVAEA